MKKIFIRLIILVISSAPLCLFAQVHTNDNLWYNNGAEVFIGTGALVTIQGDVTNNQAGVTGITHFANNGFLWTQGNMYGDNAFKQSGTGTVRLQNKTTLYTAPYASENYQVIQGGYKVNGGQSAIAASDDGSFYNLELDNQNGLVFIKSNADVRNSVDFAPASVNVDGVTIAPNGAINRLLTYDPGTATTPAAAPANGASYTATFGMMNNAPGLINFKNVSSNLEANTTIVDNAFIQGKLRRAVNAGSGGLYGFPLGLEPSAGNTGARGIQYAKLNFAANTYDVISGYFQQGSDNTDATPTAVCTITGGFNYYGSSNHGEWIFTPQASANNAYDITLYPQDYGSVSSPKFFITKDNDVPVPGAQSCATSPIGLSVTGVSGFSEFGFAGGTTALALELKSFDNTVNQCEATLNWTTATVQNLKHFEVLQSRNGAVWTIYAMVPAINNNGLETSYTQKVTLLAGDANLFRIRIVDVEGNASYSSIDNLTCSGNEFHVNAYPNPVRDVLTLEGLPEDADHIVLYDLMGRELSKQASFGHRTTIPFSHFPNGMYLVKIISNQGAVLTSIKIVK